MTGTLPLGLLLASAAMAADYTIVPDNTSYLRLEVDKTGLLRGKTHVFVFSRFQGSVRYFDSSVATSNVTLGIESQSIQCNDTWLSAKDLVKVRQYAENDMLAVDRYRNLSFRSTSVVAQGEGSLKVTGTLTIRDVTRTIAVTLGLKPAADGSLASEGTALVKLTDFNLKPPTAALGLIGTKDEMRLSFRLRLAPSN